MFDLFTTFLYTLAKHEYSSKTVEVNGRVASPTGTSRQCACYHDVRASALVPPLCGVPVSLRHPLLWHWFSLLFICHLSGVVDSYIHCSRQRHSLARRAAISPHDNITDNSDSARRDSQILTATNGSSKNLTLVL